MSRFEKVAFPNGKRLGHFEFICDSFDLLNIKEIQRHQIRLSFAISREKNLNDFH